MNIFVLFFFDVKYLRVIEGIIEVIVFNFYFFDYMKEWEIDVLKFIECDLEKVLKDWEFDYFSD